MAANTGMKIFRDFFRDSPCRKAYLLTQQKNLSHQYARNNNLKKTAGNNIGPLDSRPKTAPILPSNLAQAILSHNLLEEHHPQKKRPTTSPEGLKRRNTTTPLGSGRKPSIPNRPRKSDEETRRRGPPSTANDNVCRKQQQPKQVKSNVQNKKSSIKPCKICIDDEDCFPNAKNTPGKQATISNGFRHLVQEIEKIRLELMASEGMKQISYEQSLRLIDEIKQEVDSASERDDTATRLVPFQTTLGLPSSELALKKVKAKKPSVRSPKFTRGRISDEDFNSLKSVPSTLGKEHFKTKGERKRIEKSFEQGPLRMLLPYMKDALVEKKVRY